MDRLEEINRRASHLIRCYNYRAFDDSSLRCGFAYVLEYPDLLQRSLTAEKALEELKGLVLARTKQLLLNKSRPPTPLVETSKPHLKAWVLVPSIRNVPDLQPELVAGRSCDDARYHLLKTLIDRYTNGVKPVGWWGTEVRRYRQPHLDRLLQRPGVVKNELLRCRAGLRPAPSAPTGRRR